MRARLNWMALLVALSATAAFGQSAPPNAAPEQAAWLRPALLAKGCAVAPEGVVSCPGGLTCAIDGLVMLCNNDRACLVKQDGLECKSFEEVAAIIGGAAPGAKAAPSRAQPREVEPSSSGRCHVDAFGLLRCSDGSGALVDGGGLSRFNDGSSAIKDGAGLTRFSNGQSANTDGSGLTRFSDGSWCQKDATGLIRCYKR